jgi:hypothetical protein
MTNYTLKDTVFNESRLNTLFFSGFFISRNTYVYTIDVNDVVSSKKMADENTMSASKSLNSAPFDRVNGLNRMIKKKHT